MDKRFFITILLLISICFLIVTTTITFLTREKVANNIITFGSLKMQLIQTTLDKNNQEENVNNNEIFDITDNSMVSRMIKVKNLGNHEFFLRISLNMVGIDKNSNEFDVNDLIRYDLNFEDWIYKDGWYYYKKVVKEFDTTSNLITNIFFDTNNIMSNYQNSNFKFNVIAQAVQAENNAQNVLEVVGWPSN